MPSTQPQEDGSIAPSDDGYKATSVSGQSTINTLLLGCLPHPGHMTLLLSAHVCDAYPGISNSGIWKVSHMSTWKTVNRSP